MEKLTLFSIILVFFSSCSLDRPVDVGMIVSATGQYSPLLVTARNGAILAVEELNQHLGPEINLIVMDDESSKAKGRERLQSLIDQGVGIFIVSVTSGSYADMEETVNAHELLAISPTVSSNIFKGKDDNFFRMAADVSTYAQRLAEYAVEQRQGHTAAIYDTNNRQYGEQLIASYRQTVASLGSSMRVSVYPFDATQNASRRAIAEEVAQGNPDTVLIVTSPFDAALLSQNLIGEDYLKLFSPWSISEELVENGGRTVEGGVFFLTQEYTKADTPELITFRQRYEARFGHEASYQSVVNYDAVLILRELLDTAGSYEPQALKKAILDRSEFQGISSSYFFDLYGDTQPKLSPHTIRSGEIVILD
jgi:branched-chain amino acid transport system substrate-binding protein